MGVGHRVDGAAALVFQALRNRMAGQLGDLHQEGVGVGDAERHRHLGVRSGVVLGDPLVGLGRRAGTDVEGRLAVDRVARLIQRGTTGIDPVGAVERRVEDVGDIAEDQPLDTELLEDPLVLAEVAGVGVEAGDNRITSYNVCYTKLLRVEDVGDVAEDQPLNAELVEDPLVLAEVACVGVEAGDQV